MFENILLVVLVGIMLWFIVLAIYDEKFRSEKLRSFKKQKKKDL